MNKKALIVISVVVLLGIGSMLLREPKGVTQEPLRVSFNTWIGSGIYFVAQEKGFWQKEGIVVELEQTDESSVAKQLIASGKVDAITSWTPETVQILADSGVPIKIVSLNDVSDGADGIIAREGINTLEDLKGKTVAYETGSPSHLLLSYLLDQEGISSDEIQTINQSAADAGASFVAGKVDAAVTWEPWLSKANERKGGHLLASSKNIPILPGGPIWRAEVVKNRPEDVKAFMRGVFNAMDYVASHPDESYEIIAKGFDISKQDVIDQIPTFKWTNYEDNIKYFSKSDTSIYNVIDTTGVLWLKLGLIKKSTSADSLLDDSLLKSLNK
jgi:NitT/TauT family transport system substrate-binding protein